MTPGVVFRRIGLRASFALALAPALLLSQSPQSGLDLSSLDRSVRPQDDLYRFANGGWIARTQMPDDRVTYSAATEMTEKVEVDLHAIIQTVLALPERRSGSPAQQIADLYTSMIDEATIESLGAAPLAPVLSRIDAAANVQDLAREAGLLSASTTGGPFFASIGVDSARTGDRIVQLSQGGILLPDRDYYLKDEPAFVEAQARYRTYLDRMFTFAGRPNGAADARAVVAFETELARASWPQVDSRNTSKTNNPYTLRRLQSEMPGFDWMAWARPQGFDVVPTIVIAQPSFFKEFAALAARTPLPTLKAWLAGRYITAMTPSASRAFNEERFDFFGRVLTGQQVPRARWKRGVAIVNSFLGDAIGRMYVEKHFPPTSKARVQKIVDNLLRAYRDAIGEADWLTSNTKAEAIDKISKLTTKIGYPTTWRDYHGLLIKPDDLIGNV